MLRKTTITVEVLDNQAEGYDPSEMTLEQIAYAITFGNMSGKMEVTKVEKLPLADSIAECEKHGSDPDFF
jgi:hypothetical protein